jgi:rRNA methylase, putative, group 3
MHPVFEAINSGKPIEKVFLKKGLEGEQFRDLLSIMQENNIPFQFVPIERLDKITKGRHQGVVALIPEITYVPMEEAIERAIRKSASPTILMLDGVTDIRNLGAIARTAECMGVNCIIMPAKGGAAINAEAIKASAGALVRIDVCKVSNLRMAIFYLQQKNFKIIAATEKADKSIYNLNLNEPVAIIAGSEGKGISNSLLALSDERAKIPMAGSIESLNVSASVAIILYEILRQKRG